MSWKPVASSLLLLAGCVQSHTAPVAPMEVTGTSEVRDTMIIPTMYWKPGTDDGRGPLSGFKFYAQDSLNIHSDTIDLPATARTGSVALGPYMIGRYAGFMCVRAYRRGVASTPTCLPWVDTIVDVAPPMAIIDSVRVVPFEDTLEVRTWFRGVTDAEGAPSAIFNSAGDNAGRDRDSVIKIPTATFSALRLTGYTYGDSVNGYSCVQQERRGMVGEPKCSAWAKRIPDVPPPPPIADSAQVASLRVLPDSVKMWGAFESCLTVAPELRLSNGYPVAACTLKNTTTGETRSMVQQFCLMFLMKDGKYRMLQGQETNAFCQAQYTTLPSEQRLPGYPVALGSAAHKYAISFPVRGGYVRGLVLTARDF